MQTYLLILFNTWQGALFDSFQNKDAAAFWLLITTFLFLAGNWVVFAVSEYLFGQYLLIRWRRFMSRQFVADWLEDERHYRIQFLGEKADNPDQRISEDIRTYVTSTFSIAFSLFSTFLTLAAFVQLLWDLSARFRTEDGGAFMVWITGIPGFLVWVCLAYAVFATLVGHLDRAAADLEELQQGAHRGRFPLRHGAAARIQRAGGAARRRAGRARQPVPALRPAGRGARSASCAPPGTSASSPSASAR